MAKVNLDHLVKDKIKALKAYHVENFDCPIKLHANENSFPPPSEILDLFQDTFRTFQLNRYPDPASQRLKDVLAKRLSVTPEQLAIGNGSDELIQILIQIFCNAGDTVAFPDPTFAMYSIIAKGMGLQTEQFPLDECWDFKAEPFLDMLERTQARIVFFSYPNNPTGNCFSAAEIQKVIEGFQGITVLDEAYYDFARSTFLDQLGTHNNLILLRSLSKIGLAGLRVGYAVADPAIIEQIDKIRLPYNSNTVSQELSAVLLDRFGPVQQQIDQILEQRDWLARALAEIPELQVFPSDSNFILFRVHRSSEEVFNRLVEKGILVRDLSSHPRLKNCLRVTIGTHDENAEFITQIRSIIRAG
ncbi:histidinol-phosphate transaminase [Nitrospina watsonii]|uniref:Histidinol-phosphate aminotransferase n=1 Tax=Nitrospina watsonii TaxID=1323948 RepID=A0ABN8VWP7_9BACT|nr:histidinol-phosphate transaminase [Nitrospina watsonii]CAI2718113.1 Histidinol-phosphate aminotransferase 1 [Nitrospina watsonii]